MGRDDQTKKNLSRKVVERLRSGWIPPPSVGAIHSKEVWARQLPEEAAKALQLGTNISWQNESPYKEEVVLLREVGDLRFDGS